MATRTHVIPVGGDEPPHTCSEACKCQPLLNEDGTMVHHAFDLREARERFGRNRPGEQWVLVLEVVPTP